VECEAACIYQNEYCRLEEGGIITNCSIRILEAGEILDFNFCAANVLNKIILQSECLKEVFAELDSSSDLVEILLSPDPPYFRISTARTAGDTKVTHSFVLLTIV
jgi:cell cycle checkpoint protein